MTPQELKSSILQLAVQGRLVEQRPEEGTAEKLYRQIQEEKQRLIKEGKIKKEKPLPEITENEVPFDIPESWKWVRLCETANINGGFAFKSTKYSSNGVRVIRISDFIENGFVNDKVVRHPYDDTLSQYVLEKGNILLCMTGGTVGKTLYVKDIPEKMVVNQRVATIKSHISFSEYIYQVILAPFTQKIIQKSKNSTNDNISMDTIKSFLIPLPPLAEQKRIVAKIEELLPYIDRYEKAWSKLEDFNKRFPGDMQKSVLQMAIQGKLVEQRVDEGTAEELYTQIQTEKQRLIKEGKIKKEKPLPEITEDEIPFDIPDSWKWVRFKDICSVLTCGYASTPQYVSSTNGYPFLSAKNVKPYRFLPESHNCISKELYLKLTQNAKPEKGDILLTRVGAGIGEAAIIDKDFDFAIYVSLTLIKLIDNSLISNQYILFWLNSPIGVSSAKKNIYGKNASQGNLNVKNVREFLLPLPPLAEQKRIVQKLEEILPLCERLL